MILGSGLAQEANLHEPEKFALMRAFPVHDERRHYLGWIQVTKGRFAAWDWEETFLGHFPSASGAINAISMRDDPTLRRDPKPLRWPRIKFDEGRVERIGVRPQQQGQHEQKGSD